MFAQAVSVISSLPETTIAKGKTSKQAIAAAAQELPNLLPEPEPEPSPVQDAPPRARPNLLMALVDEKVAA